MDMQISSHEHLEYSQDFPRKLGLFNVSKIFEKIGSSRYSYAASEPSLVLALLCIFPINCYILLFFSRIF